MRRAALFLDRDGVINVDHGYVHRPEEFEFIDGIFDIVAAAKAAGYIVVIITNQAGIGRGYYSEQQFHQLMRWVRRKFEDNGGKIDAIYYCPFHPVHGVGHYKKDSELRKPKPGMILQAAMEHGIDLELSILIGDKLSDMQAGQRAGVGTLVLYGAADEQFEGICINKLADAMTSIVRQDKNPL